MKSYIWEISGNARFAGEEIKADAKKCRHCGEWLSQQCPDCGGWVDVSAAECTRCGRRLKEQKTELKRQDKGTSGRTDDEGEGCVKGCVVNLAGCFGNLVWIAALIALAWFTLPSDIEHKQRLKADVREGVKDMVRAELDSQDVLTSVFGNALLNINALSDGVIDAAVKQRFAFEIKNYKVVSLGMIRDRSTGEEIVASVAAFGIVFPFASEIIKTAKNFE